MGRVADLIAAVAAHYDRDVDLSPISLTNQQIGELPTNDLRELSSALSRRSSELRRHRPRPIKKFYGLRGPTPEQLEEYKIGERRWNREYRAVQRMLKRAIEVSNKRYYEGEH